MTHIQLSQYVPMGGTNLSRVRTSYETVIPYMVDYPFAVVAKQDGKVLQDNKELKCLKIEYKDGTRQSIQYGEQRSRYSSSGIFITQSIVPHSKLKTTFKQNDTIVYNETFFAEDPFSNRVFMKLGCNIKVAFMDKEGTEEDANIISKRFSTKTTFKPIHEREISLNFQNQIVKFADIGTKVVPITPLITFEESEGLYEFDEEGYDEETIDLINKLNRSTPKADFGGVVVDIEVYYKSPRSAMNKSMQKFVTYVEERKKKLYEFTKDTSNVSSKPGEKEYLEKIGYIDIEDDTLVIKYFIQDEYGTEHGDKCCIHSALKTVNSLVMDKPILTKDRKHEVDMIYAGVGLMARIINSPIKTGAAALVMEALQNEILEDYFS